MLYDTGQQPLGGLLNAFGGWLSLLVLFILWGIAGAVLKHNISPISHKNHPKEALYNDNIISDKYHSSLSQESVIKQTHHVRGKSHTTPFKGQNIKLSGVTPIKHSKSVICA